jgi:VIT1/CCC1 family predicted Fe2+/Mn2+ transporter
MATSSQKTQSDIGYYIAPLVYGANDGIITTFAIISGAAGATLKPEVMVIMGIASLFADGFSMGVSSYLSKKSQYEYETSNDLASKTTHYSPVKHGTATFSAFVVAGALPIIPFIILDPAESSQFFISAIATVAAFFFVGSARSYLLEKEWWWAGLEMLLVGGSAACIAYSLGWVVNTFVM